MPNRLAGGLARVLVAPLHRRFVAGRRREVLVGHLDLLIPAGERLTGLDVGCGSGELARTLMDYRPELELTGVEVQPRPRTAIPVAPFDGRTLPWPDGHFDFVLLAHVLHHAADPAALLADCRRVARRFVIVIDHYRESEWDQLRLRLMDWVGNRGDHDLLPYTYYSRAQWAVFHERADLALAEEVRELGLYPFPASLLFGGALHFIARLVPAAPRP